MIWVLEKGKGGKEELEEGLDEIKDGIEKWRTESVLLTQTRIFHVDPDFYVVPDVEVKESWKGNASNRSQHPQYSVNTRTLIYYYSPHFICGCCTVIHSPRLAIYYK